MKGLRLSHRQRLRLNPSGPLCAALPALHLCLSQLHSPSQHAHRRRVYGAWLPVLETLVEPLEHARPRGECRTSPTNVISNVALST